MRFLLLARGILVVFVCSCTSPTVHSLSCGSVSDCPPEYKSCCMAEEATDHRCSYWEYCNGFCSSPSDCATDEHCVERRCIPSNCKSCPSDCKYGKCDKETPNDEYTFSPASIIGFSAVVIIGSCIACTLYCGCARRRQQPQISRPAAVTAPTRNEQDENESPPPSPPLLEDAPPPYHSLEMISRIEPPPPSYHEALRNTHNNITAV